MRLLPPVIVPAVAYLLLRAGHFFAKTLRAPFWLEALLLELRALHFSVKTLRALVSLALGLKALTSFVEGPKVLHQVSGLSEFLQKPHPA